MKLLLSILKVVGCILYVVLVTIFIAIVGIEIIIDNNIAMAIVIAAVILGYAVNNLTIRVRLRR